MNGGFFASHQGAQVDHAMRYTDVAQPMSTIRPSDLPAYSQSHVDLMTSASEIAVPPVGEEEEEEDVEEDLLRAQLLMSLAQKRKEKEDAEVGGAHVSSHKTNLSEQNLKSCFVYVNFMNV